MSRFDKDITERLRWDKRYTLGHVPVTIEDAAVEVERLRAEIERLRAALKQIEEFPYVGTKASQSISLIARAALAPVNEQHSDEAKSS